MFQATPVRAASIGTYNTLHIIPLTLLISSDNTVLRDLEQLGNERPNSMPTSPFLSNSRRNRVNQIKARVRYWFSVLYI